jgi:hypothetical protein
MSCARTMAAWCVTLSCELSTSNAGLQDPEKWKQAFGVPTGKPSTPLTGPLLETVWTPAGYCLQ